MTSKITISFNKTSLVIRAAAGLLVNQKRLCWLVSGMTFFTMKPDNLIGQKFGKLTIISKAIDIKKYQYLYNCICDCGNEKVAPAGHLRTGHTKSCGCSKGAMISESKITHGLRHSSEFNAWSGIIQRCTNPKDPGYKNYGGRGITVCSRWLGSFENFLADMGLKPTPQHSIDRYPNNDGDYGPGNCRWATRKEQNRNTRVNRLLTINGETKCVTEWAEINGILPKTLLYRVNKGFAENKIFNQPC